MKTSLSAVLVTAVLCVAQDLPPVSSDELQALISLDDLLSGAQRLQDFANASPGGHREFGTSGHNETVTFLYEQLQATNYYEVQLQASVNHAVVETASLHANGEEVETMLFYFSPYGTAQGRLVAADNFGCMAADFSADTAGAIVLIARGGCPFAIQASNAYNAGAVGTVIYNNVDEPLKGELNWWGDYTPTVGITQSAGEDLLALIVEGIAITADLAAIETEIRTSYNVIAETKGGDHDNVIVIGAHSDSVRQGPGINDNGSGTIGILTVALALTKFATTNAVRFCFFTAEEPGLFGSQHYVNELSKTPSEIAKVRAYLNVDMIASPNYKFGIYDGDGSSFGTSGPAGSAEIEADFHAFYKSKGVNSTATEFNGRSDYGPFLQHQIACGGLFTGAEGRKTAAEELMFGGVAGAPYDENYHGPGDTMDNLAHDAFLLNAQSVANSVALYATSLDKIPVRAPPTIKRGLRPSTQMRRRALMRARRSWQ